MCHLFLAVPRGERLKGCKMAGQILPGSQPPKLLERVRATMRLNRYSPGTEQAYIDPIKRYIRFHGVRHPKEMGQMK